VPLGDGFLVDPEVRRHPGPLGALPTLDRALEDVPGLIPTDAQNPGGPPNVGLLQHIDGQTLEQGREAGAGLGPRQPHLADAVGGALDPRRLRVQVGHELATVQMAPHAFLCVVIQRQTSAALGTRPAHVAGVAGPHVDPLLLDVQLYGPHGPRLFEPQQMAVEFDIAHSPSPPDEIELEPSLHHPVTHSEAG
jgi:hypothetical protein